MGLNDLHPYAAPMLSGHPVIVSEIGTHAPKIQVSPSFKWITEEARRDMNQWLADRFGCKCQALQMLSPVTGRQTLVVCQHVWDKLKNADIGARP